MLKESSLNSSHKLFDDGLVTSDGGLEAVDDALAEDPEGSWRLVPARLVKGGFFL